MVKHNISLCLFLIIFYYNPPIIFLFFFMAKKARITLSQIMAILALLGIFLSIVGTAWIGRQPVVSEPIPGTEPLVSREKTIPTPPAVTKATSQK